MSKFFTFAPENTSWHRMKLLAVIRVSPSNSPSHHAPNAPCGSRAFASVPVPGRTPSPRRSLANAPQGHPRGVVPQGAEGTLDGVPGRVLGGFYALYIVNSIAPPLNPVGHPHRRVDGVQRLRVVPAQPPQGVHRGPQPRVPPGV